jgi:regulator of sigma E protease
MSVVLLILGLLLFVGLVVVHEFGHFIAARRNGVDVEEFGIGFPPTAWSRKLKSGLLFSLNWLPLGGFVRLKGEHDSATTKGSFGAASLSTKVKIMTAGVGMNLLTAFLLLTFLALVGMPKLLDNQFTVNSDTKVTKNQVLVAYIEPKSPAAKAGLQVRDRLVSIKTSSKNYDINTAEALPKATQHTAGQRVTLVIERAGKEQTLPTTLRTKTEVEASKKSSEPKGYLGVSPSEYTLRRSTWSAPVVAVGFMKQLTVETFKGLGNALWNAVRGQGKAASSQVSGPVGIFMILKEGSLLGFQFVLMIIAIISLTLAIMNVLPIPALDGGRLFVTLLYRKVIRRPLSQSLEERIHGTGFALLMLLFILITVVDIRRF